MGLRLWLVHRYCQAIAFLLVRSHRGHFGGWPELSLRQRIHLITRLHIFYLVQGKTTALVLQKHAQIVLLSLLDHRCQVYVSVWGGIAADVIQNLLFVSFTEQAMLVPQLLDRCIFLLYCFWRIVKFDLGRAPLEVHI